MAHKSKTNNAHAHRTKSFYLLKGPPQDQYILTKDENMIPVSK